jgi:hypothetical protein
MIYRYCKLSNLRFNPAVNLLDALWLVSSAFAIDADISAVLFLSLEVRLVKRSPFLLVVLDVWHEDTAHFNDESNHHEDKTEHEREAEIVGGVLERCARDVVYPELCCKVLVRILIKLIVAFLALTVAHERTHCRPNQRTSFLGGTISEKRTRKQVVMMVPET